MDEGIRTGELDDVRKFTEEVGDFQVPAEGQLQCHQTVQQGDHSAKEQGEYNQQNTEADGHDNHVL